MPSIDVRSRGSQDDVEVDPTAFLREVAELVDRRGHDAARGAARQDLPPMTLVVDGRPVTFEPVGGRMQVHGRRTDHLVVDVDQVAFSDLVQDVSSTFGLQMQGRARITVGRAEDFLSWEPILRSLLDGRGVYEPGSIDFVSDTGDELDLQRTFRPDDDPAEMGAFLAETGYLHVSRVFSPTEMDAVSADLDRSIADARRDDGSSWWARTRHEGWYPARILGFNHSSPALRELLADPRFTRFGTLTDDQMVQRDPLATDAAEALLKKVGVVEGISDVVWHKDCSMGGHSRRCSGLTVGICVTGAGPTNGELGVAAGSHRANVSPLGVDGLDLPRIPLPTEKGDITVHCSCTLHMSRPPVHEERRVVYSGFSLAPRPGEEAAPADPAEARRARLELSDRSRGLRLRRSSGAVSFDLD